MYIVRHENEDLKEIDVALVHLWNQYVACYKMTMEEIWLSSYVNMDIENIINMILARWGYRKNEHGYSYFKIMIDTLSARYFLISHERGKLYRGGPSGGWHATA